MAGPFGVGEPRGMRKRYSEQERDELVEEVAKGRATVAEAADGLGVARSTAYLWVRRSRTETRQARRAVRKPRPPREATFVELMPRAKVSSAIAVRISKSSARPSVKNVTGALAVAGFSEALLAQLKEEETSLNALRARLAAASRDKRPKILPHPHVIQGVYDRTSRRDGLLASS